MLAESPRLQESYSGMLDKTGAHHRVSYALLHDLPGKGVVNRMPEIIVT